MRRQSSRLHHKLAPVFEKNGEIAPCRLAALLRRLLQQLDHRRLVIPLVIGDSRIQQHREIVHRRRIARIRADDGVAKGHGRQLAERHLMRRLAGGLVGLDEIVRPVREHSVVRLHAEIDAFRDLPHGKRYALALGKVVHVQLFAGHDLHLVPCELFPRHLAETDLAHLVRRTTPIRPIESRVGLPFQEPVCGPVRVARRSESHFVVRLLLRHMNAIDSIGKFKEPPIQAERAFVDFHAPDPVRHRWPLTELHLLERFWLLQPFSLQRNPRILAHQFVGPVRPSYRVMAIAHMRVEAQSHLIRNRQPKAAVLDEIGPEAKFRPVSEGRRVFRRRLAEAIGDVLVLIFPRERGLQWIPFFPIVLRTLVPKLGAAYLVREIRQVEVLLPGRKQAAMNVLRTPQRVPRVDHQPLAREFACRRPAVRVRTIPRPAGQLAGLVPMQHVFPVAARTKPRTKPLQLPLRVVDRDKLAVRTVFACFVRGEVDANDRGNRRHSVSHPEAADVHARRLDLLPVRQNHVKHVVPADFDPHAGLVVLEWNKPYLLLVSLEHLPDKFAGRLGQVLHLDFISLNGIGGPRDEAGVQRAVGLVRTVVWLVPQVGAWDLGFCVKCRICYERRHVRCCGPCLGKRNRPFDVDVRKLHDRPPRKAAHVV